jgi:hypothetical protein
VVLEAKNVIGIVVGIDIEPCWSWLLLSWFSIGDIGWWLESD